MTRRFIDIFDQHLQDASDLIDRMSDLQRERRSASE